MARSRPLPGTPQGAAGAGKSQATAPTAGGLWLAASKVRSQTSGFDQKAEDYLRASYLTASREGDIARLRLVYVSVIGPLMRTAFEEEHLRDRETVRELFPAFDRKYQDWVDARAKGGIDDLRR